MLSVKVLNHWTKVRSLEKFQNKSKNTTLNFKWWILNLFARTKNVCQFNFYIRRRFLLRQMARVPARKKGNKDPILACQSPSKPRKQRNEKNNFVLLLLPRFANAPSLTLPWNQLLPPKIIDDKRIWFLANSKPDERTTDFMINATKNIHVLPLLFACAFSSTLTIQKGEAADVSFVSFFFWGGAIIHPLNGDTSADSVILYCFCS